MSEEHARRVPATILSFLVAPLSGKLAERFGIRYFLGAGLALNGIGLLLMGGVSAGDDWTGLLLGFVLAGVGIGLTNPPLATAAVGVVDQRRSGMASGINSTFRQVGIATGIAGLGAIFQHVVNSRAGEFGRAVAATGAEPLRPPAGAGQFSDFIAFGAYREVAARLGGGVEQAGREAFLAGLNQILLYAGILALVGAVLSLILVRPKDFAPH